MYTSDKPSGVPWWLEQGCGRKMAGRPGPRVLGALRALIGGVTFFLALAGDAEGFEQERGVITFGRTVSAAVGWVGLGLSQNGTGGRETSQYVGDPKPARQRDLRACAGF